MNTETGQQVDGIATMMPTTRNPEEPGGKNPLNPDKQVVGILLPTDPHFQLFSVIVGSSN